MSTPLKYSNLESWRFYLEEINSPDSFINMSFYSMISAALQRRVWLGSEHKPLFPNQFIILVADPGIGKGMVISPYKTVITSFKISRDTGRMEQDVLTPEKIQDMQDEVDLAAGATHSFSKKKEPLLVIPIGADCTTFAKLVNTQSNSVRRINPSFKSTFAPNGVYSHCSLSIILPEMETFFHKQSEQLVSFLTHAWDCETFDYETKHQGEDRIRNSCLNLIAGTTPRFMEKSLDVDLIAGGFSSRSLFVYEHSNRSNDFKEIKPTPAQLKALQQVIDHVGRLTRLFGQLEYEPEAFALLKYHFEEVDPYTRRNNSLKLNHYYARKRVHAQKMAIAVHFAESTDMIIRVEDVKLALTILEALETKMHFALAYKSNSPLAAALKQIRAYLRNIGRADLVSIWGELEGSLNETELKEALRFLVATNELRLEDGPTGRQWTSLVWEEKQNLMKKRQQEMESPPPIVVIPKPTEEESPKEIYGT